MSKPKDGLPSKYDVFLYWKDKCFTDIGTSEVEGEYPYSKSEPAVMDWAEPRCFGCNRLADLSTYDPDGCLDEEQVKKIWNKAKYLERAHIVPEALGGKPTPDNIVLLCPTCHAESPDTSEPRYMFLWLFNRRMGRQGSVYKRACDLAEMQGIPKIFVPPINHGFCAGISSTHGSVVMSETQSASLVEIAKQNIEEFSKHINFEVNKAVESINERLQMDS